MLSAAPTQCRTQTKHGEVQDSSADMIINDMIKMRDGTIDWYRSIDIIDSSLSLYLFEKLTRAEESDTSIGYICGDKKQETELTLS